MSDFPSPNLPNEPQNEPEIIPPSSQGFPSPEQPPISNPFPSAPSGGFGGNFSTNAPLGQGFTPPAQISNMFTARAEGDPANDQWAFISLALGAITIFMACCLTWIPCLNCFACFAPLVAVGGLVSGYLGLQSTQKQMAQVGLGLNALGIVFFFLGIFINIVAGVGTSLFSGFIVF